MYYSGITLFKETNDIAKTSLCFVFSCVEMLTVISDIRLTVLVNMKFRFNRSIFNTFFINTFFYRNKSFSGIITLSYKEIRDIFIKTD